MSHLAIDLGSTKSHSDAILFDPQRPGWQQPIRFLTTREELTRVVRQHTITTVIIECCRPAHWVSQLLADLAIEVLIANTNAPAFREAGRRAKTDRLDAQRLMRLFLLGELKTLRLRSEQALYQQQLLELRSSAVAARTELKNRIRSLLDMVSLTLPAGKSGWTKACLQQLTAWSETAPAGVPGGTWQSMLRLYLEDYHQRTADIKRYDSLVDEAIDQDSQAESLQGVPGIGRMTAVALSASIDDPQRFRSSKQVSKYSGFSPVPHQSGKSKRDLGISRASNSLMRGYVFEAVMIGLFTCKEPWLQLQYERLLLKVGHKRKALCALARRLYVQCWRMLKQGLSWEDVTEPALEKAGIVRE